MFRIWNDLDQSGDGGGGVVFLWWETVEMFDGILFYENVNDSMPMRFQSWILTYIFWPSGLKRNMFNFSFAIVI